MYAILFRVFTATATLTESFPGVWELTLDSLNEALETQPDLIVELYSHKCGHCIEFTPHYNGLGEYLLKNDSMYAARIEVEENPGALDRFDSDTVPVILAFRNKVHFKFTDKRTASNIYLWFKKLIKKPLDVYKDYNDFIQNFKGNNTMAYFGDLYSPLRSSFNLFFDKSKDYEYAVIQSLNTSLNKKAPGVIIKSEGSEKVFSLTESSKDLMNFIELNKGIKIREWSEETRDLTFKQQLKTLFFFCNEDEFPIYLPRIQAVSEKYHEKIMITYTDLNANFTESLVYNGFKREKQPMAVIFDFVVGTMRYVCPEITEQGLINCLIALENHKLVAYYMSEDEPEQEFERGVRVLTGTTFEKFVFNKEKHFLVYFYAKGQGESEKHLKTIERVSFELSHIPNLEIGKLSVYTNELQNLKLSKMPGLKLYPKSKKYGLDFSDHFGKFRIIQYLNSHLS